MHFHLLPHTDTTLSSSLLHKTNRVMKLENLLNPVTRTGRSPNSSDSALPTNIATHPDLYYCRVPKACTHCRREKSRCDLRRPCHNCVKRNRSKECVDGCYPCRQMKKICTNSWPCPSCMESDVECVFTPPPVKRQTRRKAGRSKNPRCNKARCETGRPCAHCKRKSNERPKLDVEQGDNPPLNCLPYAVSQSHEDYDDTLAQHKEENHNTSVSPVTPIASVGIVLPSLVTSPIFKNRYRPYTPLYTRDSSESPTLAVTTSSMRSTHRLF